MSKKEHVRIETRIFQILSSSLPLIPLQFIPSVSKKKKKSELKIQSMWDRKWVRQEEDVVWKSVDSGAEPEQIGSPGQSWGKGISGRKDNLRVSQLRLKSMTDSEQNTFLWGCPPQESAEPTDMFGDLQPENCFCHRRKGLAVSSSLPGKEAVCMKPTWQR